jgi:hypothetical protein
MARRQYKAAWGWRGGRAKGRTNAAGRVLERTNGQEAPAADVAGMFAREMEAETGIEPMSTDLQSAA